MTNLRPRFGNVSRVSMVLVGAVTLQACTRDLGVEVSMEAGSAVLSFHRNHLVFWSRPASPCVKLISVHEAQTDVQVWAVRPLNRDCVEMSTVSVGAIPTGFKLRGPARSLVQGRVYYAAVIADTEAGQSDVWVQP